MQSNKNIWILSLTLLLVFLQPLVSFGHVSNVPSEIVNPQEEITLLKSQSAKAIVLQEISVTSTELIVSSDSANKRFLFEYNNSENPKKFQRTSIYLIDFRSVLTTRIFPFHFFL